jgi:hypothetical protein
MKRALEAIEAATLGPTKLELAFRTRAAEPQRPKYVTQHSHGLHAAERVVLRKDGLTCMCVLLVLQEKNFTRALREAIWWDSAGMARYVPDRLPSRG